MEVGSWKVEGGAPVELFYVFHQLTKETKKEKKKERKKERKKETNKQTNSHEFEAKGVDCNVECARLRRDLTLSPCRGGSESRSTGTRSRPISRMPCSLGS
jgi:hypothetical protein